MQVLEDNVKWNKMSSDTENRGFQKEQGLGWGKTLPVESVQEMAKRNSTYVPDRYIRDQGDRPESEDFDQHSLDVPVIDFSLLSCGQKERVKMHQACKNWGFFQIVNHGIAEDVLQKTKAAAAGFFNLPLEEKKKYAMAADDIQGYGQAYVVSEEQKLDWGDLIFLITNPKEMRRLHYWPTVVPGFMDAIEKYSVEVNRVAEELLAYISLIMNMSKEGLMGLHGGMKQGMRFNYYPKCSRPDLVLGVAPHSDGSSLTILLQDDDITGLQIQHQGRWVPVKPIRNALVVNIGDVIEAWSNGMFLHRAVTNDKKARMSTAAFIIPNEDVEIGPVGEMVDEDKRPRLYKKIKYIDYIRHTLARKMDGKSHTEFLKLNEG